MPIPNHPQSFCTMTSFYSFFISLSFIYFCFTILEESFDPKTKLNMIFFVKTFHVHFYSLLLLRRTLWFNKYRLWFILICLFLLTLEFLIGYEPLYVIREISCILRIVYIEFLSLASLVLFLPCQFFLLEKYSPLIRIIGILRNYTKENK